MKRTTIWLAALLALGFAAACSSSDDNGSPPPPPVGFQQPAGTVAVNMKVSDVANQVFAAGEMEWKGSMVYDTATRKITYDATWGGPWAPLYDDGPWNVDPPGHEPIGSVAGDHIWGVTVFATPPATGSQGYEFGLNDAVYQTNFNNGWIWRGSNGTFSVAAGATAAIDAVATPFVLPAFGTTDLELTLDTANLGPGTWDTSVVKVKGSATAWASVTLTDSGGGLYVFTLSDNVGAGNPFFHSGLLNSGDKPEFIFVLGTGDGLEYKDANAVAETTGVTAATMPAGGAWAPATVEVAANNNTFVTVP